MDGLWGLVLVVVLFVWTIYALARRSRVDERASEAAVSYGPPSGSDAVPARSPDRLTAATDALIDALAGFRIAHDFALARSGEQAERLRLESIEAIIEAGGLGRALVVLADEVTAWGPSADTARAPWFPAEERVRAASPADPKAFGWSFRFHGDTYTVSIRPPSVAPALDGIRSRSVELSWRGEPVLAVEVEQYPDVEFGPRRSFRTARFAPGPWMGGLVAIDSHINLGRERVKRADRGERLRA
ncbi:hypothetical protein [Prosthecomicrobium sp. N25]|uniref:hypothetical protein n=1 Tax=Prosthecomicrobium sp. N25 TaxID=3129254 RepID=UPI0030782AD6